MVLRDEADFKEFLLLKQADCLRFRNETLGYQSDKGVDWTGVPTSIYSFADIPAPRNGELPHLAGVWLFNTCVRLLFCFYVPMN